MHRIMAIDHGDVRTGLAVSDALGFGTGHAETIESRNEDEVIRHICAAIADFDVEELVVGLPKNMDGSDGPRCMICRAFADRLTREVGLPVTLWDERRTTADAHRILAETGKRQKKHRGVVDAVAASLILEGYLAHLKNS